jgi:hypothetical protein
VVLIFVKNSRGKGKKNIIFYVDFVLFFKEKIVPGFYQKIKIIPGQTPNFQPG